MGLAQPVKRCFGTEALSNSMIYASWHGAGHSRALEIRTRSLREQPSERENLCGVLFSACQLVLHAERLVYSIVIFVI